MDAPPHFCNMSRHKSNSKSVREATKYQSTKARFQYVCACPTCAKHGDAFIVTIVEMA